MSSPIAYRPDIDGLRAMAVLAVLLYHYGATWLPGGFTGVDVFFVISGYLITSILKYEIESGKFSLIVFYDRRVRRILPPLLVVLVSTMAAGWFLLLPGDYAATGRSAAYAAVGFGNLYYFWNTGYFDQAAEMQPLLHTWSLGVEEQFYIVWPIIILLALSFIRWRRIFLAIFGLALILSFAYSVNMVVSDPKAAFFLPHARAWELASGALLAFLPAIASWTLSQAVSILGAGLIAASFLVLTPKDPFPGPSALAACLGAALVIWPKQKTYIGQILAVRPMVWIGLHSYSLYLWHWPLLVLYRNYIGGAYPSAQEAAILAAIALGLSFLTLVIVEKPARHWQPNYRLSIGAGIAATSCVAFVGANIVNKDGFPQRLSSQANTMNSLQVMWDWHCPRSPPVADLSQFCLFGAEWERSTSKILLYGDSHAEHLAPLLEPLATKHNSSVLIARTTGCPANIDGLIVHRYRTDVADYSTYCHNMHRTMVAALEKNHDIATVIFTASWSRNIPVLYSQDETKRSNDIGERLTLEGLERTIAAIAIPQRTIWLISDVPQWMWDPVPCMTAGFGLLRRPCADSQLAIAQSFFVNFQGWSRHVFGEIARRRSDVRVALIGEAMCPHTLCIARIGAEPLYRDVSHIRRNLPDPIKLRLADLIGLEAIFAPRADQQLRSLSP